ncbi:MAG: HIT family protein [Burkholderiales bacterium]
MPKLRVVRVLDAPSFPAFYRVIWQAHVAEWTDLESADRALCLEAVARVEQALRSVLAPRKVNLASLGNMVPHLHWHVVARFDWDTHFPQPIWGAAERAADDGRLSIVRERLALVDQNVAQTVAELA